MYILRTVVNDKNGHYIIDNWKVYDSLEEMIDKTYKIDPDEYQCFEANEITNEVFLKIEKKIAKEEKRGRKEVWEKLNLEFGVKN